MNARADISVCDVSKIWDISHVHLPDRSRLHHLAPLGINTPYVECLTSYLSRLAQSHHVLPSKLIQQEIKSCLPRGYQGQGLRGTQIYSCARTLNGTGVMAKDWVGALEALTFRSDLSFLTMLPWKEVFPTQGLLRFMRAWCPNCYAEWKRKDGILYDPLLWAVNDVTICLNHSRLLAINCPHCDRLLPHLDRRYRPGYCSKCNGWLGSTCETERNRWRKGIGDEYEWYEWVSTNVGDLIATSNKVSLAPRANRIAEIVSAFGKKYHEGNMQAFARWLGVYPRNVHCWARGEKTPKLLTLLHVCYRLNISVVEFLTSNNIINDHDLRGERAREWNLKEEGGKRVNRDKIRRRLKSILSKNKCPPPTMKEVSEELGVSYRRLYYIFPELCRAISARHSAYRQECKLRNVKTACEEIMKIVLLLHAEGLEPNQGRVARLMNKAAYIREEKVWTTYLSIRQELGYDNSKFIAVCK
jgi:AraC-like DNA-binding protein